MRILVAEDDPMLRDWIGITLSSMGHSPVLTCDGEEALAAFKKEHFPLVITDWLMPLVDGIALTKRIREFTLLDRARRSLQTVVLMITAGDVGQSQAIAAGVDDFFQKPINEETLKARVTVAERWTSACSELCQLRGLLPICAYCKNIRDREGEWSSVEAYITRRSGFEFSHTYCPDCIERFVKPEMENFKDSPLGNADPNGTNGPSFNE